MISFACKRVDGLAFPFRGLVVKLSKAPVTVDVPSPAFNAHLQRSPGLYDQASFILRRHFLLLIEYKDDLKISKFEVQEH